MFMVNKKKENYLYHLAKANGFSLDDVIAIYAVIGDDLFFLANLLKGRTITFAKKQTFPDATSMDSMLIREVPPNSMYKVGQVVEVGDDEYTVAREPFTILNHVYVVLERDDD